MACDYLEHEPDNMLIYCDPPYANTTTYSACDKFDSNLFWKVMRRWSKNNKVIISEYSAPEDFQCVLEIPTKTIIRDVNNKPLQSVERLFTYKG